MSQQIHIRKFLKKLTNFRGSSWVLKKITSKIYPYEHKLSPVKHETSHSIAEGRGVVTIFLSLSLSLAPIFAASSGPVRVLRSGYGNEGAVPHARRIPPAPTVIAPSPQTFFKPPVRFYSIERVTDQQTVWVDSYTRGGVSFNAWPSTLSRLAIVTASKFSENKKKKKTFIIYLSLIN